MATATMNGPNSHAQQYGTLGFDYVFAEQEILLELQDTLDVMGLGLVQLVGDLAGSGTDTIRVTDVGNIGWSLPFTALDSETDTVEPSPVNLGYETVTIAQFGLAHSETYKSQVLGREEGVKLDALKARVPQSWMRTFRQRVTLAGSGISTAVGSASTSLSIDDHLDLATAYRTNLGNAKPSGMVDPAQFDELMRSYRQDPAFQNSAADFASLMGLSDSQVHRNVGGLGIDLALSDDVVQSGGAYQGFVTPPGGMGWAVANTSPIKPSNSVGAMYVPQFGLFIEELADQGGQTTRMYRATTFFGVALGSARVFTQRRLISAV